METHMVQYEQQEMESTRERSWKRWSAISAIVGGVLTVGVNLYLFTVLTPQQFPLIEPPGILGHILLTLALPACYLSERHWFGRVALVGFGLMALGTIVTAIALPIGTYVAEVAFLGYILGMLVLALGTLVFGVAMLRTKAAPQLAAWLLIAALPVGLPLVYGFTTYVMGQTDVPWAGPLVFYGLAWIVLGRSLLARGTETDAATIESAPQ